VSLQPQRGPFDLLAAARLALPPGGSPKALRASAVEGLRAGHAAALALIEAHTRSASKAAWRFSTRLGRYGDDYILRAATAWKGLGALSGDEAIYATTDDDDRGEPLHGSRAYRIRFADGGDLPADAFWSISLYGHDRYFVPNALGRHALGSRSRLARTPGIGAAKACRLLAAIELGRRTLFISPPARVPLADPASVAAFLLPRYGAHPTERLGILLLDSRHRLIRPHIVSEGGTSATLAEPHDVFREAMIAHASAVILFHNHPSGDPTPTQADVDVTRRMVDAGKIVGIDVLDHFVLADRSYCAMRALTRAPWRE
jgi:DNA repair protein RadC